MKLPSTVFVLHCPKLNPERKEFLEKHLQERVPIRDVRWCEDYNHDHLFVEWLRHTQKLPYGHKITSGLVKFLDIFKTMVDEDISSSIILNDDAMFHRDWLRIFDSITLPESLLFVNLGTALFIPDLVPQMEKCYVIHNNGGCEGVYVTKQFAKLFLENLNMNYTIDIMFHGFLMSIGHPLLCIPVCYQTSIIEKNTSLDHDSRTDGPHWQKFVQGYGQTTKLDYFELLKDFEKYTEVKERKEKQILDLYGKRVNLRNIDFVLHTSDYCNEIIN
jgi:hypothetical protein